MSKNEVVLTLIEFFRDQFSEDPIGVGEWLAQKDQDVDEFEKELGNMENEIYRAGP